MYKIAGALAAKGGSLDEVYKVAEWTASNIGTIGVGLEHCHVRLLSTQALSHLLTSHRCPEPLLEKHTLRPTKLKSV